MYPFSRQSTPGPAISSSPAKHWFSGRTHSSATRFLNAAAQRIRSSMSFMPSSRICTPATSSAARNGYSGEVECQYLRISCRSCENFS